MTNGLLSRGIGSGILAMTVALFSGCSSWSGKKDITIDPVRTYNDARIVLYQAAEDPDPRVRCKAIEALAESDGPDAGAIMLQSLKDNCDPVSFSAAMAIGDVRYGPAKPVLQEMIKVDVQPKLKCAMIYALHRLGDDSYTGELGGMIQDTDKWVRATAAMIMGRMGEPGAMEPLKSLHRTDYDPVVQLQVVEAMSQLGDERAFVLLETFAKGQYMEDRIIAVQALGRLSNARSLVVLRQLMDARQQEPAVRVAAAGSLAKRGEQVDSEFPLKAAVEPEVVLRRFQGRAADISPRDINNLRIIAILTLEYVPDPVVPGNLAAFLNSSDGGVRVASAKALLHLLRAYKPSAEPFVPKGEDGWAGHGKGWRRENRRAQVVFFRRERLIS